MLRRSERDAGAVGSRHHIGVDEAIFEMALDGDRLTFRHQLSAFTAGPGVHQHAAAVVLDDKFVAKDLGDLPFDRDRTGSFICAIGAGCNSSTLCGRDFWM
jgi:hypothetical protein